MWKKVRNFKTRKQHSLIDTQFMTGAICQLKTFGSLGVNLLSKKTLNSQRIWPHKTSLSQLLIRSDINIFLTQTLKIRFQHYLLALLEQESLFTSKTSFMTDFQRTSMKSHLLDSPLKLLLFRLKTLLMIKTR